MFAVGWAAAIMAFVSWRRRHKELGGWLLFYYLLLYFNVVLGVVLLAGSLRTYLPSTWETAPDLYPWFLASSVPGMLIVFVQLFVAEALRMKRTWAWVRRLIIVLGVDFLLSLMALAIDWQYFPENVGINFKAMLFPLIWVTYFLRSKRVRRVLVTKDWGAPLVGQSGSALTERPGT